MGHRTTTRIAASALCAALIAAALGFGLLRPARPRWNVLLITLDTTRADRLGCYGHPAARTPALDALAERGVRYANAFTHVPLTLPSHATMMTGLLPPEHGLRDNGRAKLGSDLPTLAELFAADGYRTAAFVASFVLDKRFGVDRGFETYDDRMAPSDRPDDLFGMENPANVVAGRATAWLERDSDQPFFCWLHFFDPHVPYRAPEPYRSRHADGYDAEVSFMDAQIGRVIALLRRRGLLETTLIVVAGDHGEAFGEHGEREHGALVYDSTMRVPLIIVPPGGAARPRVAEGVAGLVDVAPTLLRAAGLERADAMRGRDLLGAASSAMSYGESHFLMNGYGWAPLYSITGGSWKYVECPEPELYDLSTDPGETTNRHAAEPGRAADMKARLVALRKQMKTVQAASVELDRRALAGLRELGYLAGGVSGHRTGDGASRKDPKAMIHVHNACERAGALIDAGRQQEVLGLLGPLVERTSDSAELRERLVDACRGVGKWKDAQGHAEAYLGQNPTDRAMVRTLGLLLLRQGRAEEAAKVLTHGLRLPRCLTEPVTASGVARLETEMRILLATACCRLGKLDRAAAQYRLVLESAPTDALAHVSLADILNLQGRYEASLPHYRSALEHAKGNPAVKEAGIRTNLGVALCKLGRPEEAIEQHRMALKAASGWSEVHEVHINLGDALLAKGQGEAALAKYREAARLRPDSAGPLKALSKALARLGRPEEAKDMLARISAMKGKN